MERKGKVSYVAKTGGVKLENDERWYNPPEEHKETIKSELQKGMLVTVSFEKDNDKSVNACVFTLDTTSNNVNSESKTTEREDRIWRCQALNLAVRLIDAEPGLTDEDKVESMFELADLIVHTAKKTRYFE